MKHAVTNRLHWTAKAWQSERGCHPYCGQRHGWNVFL